MRQIRVSLKQNGDALTGILVDEEGESWRLRARRKGGGFRGILHYNGYDITLVGKLVGDRLECSLSYGIVYSKKVRLKRTKKGETR